MKLQQMKEILDLQLPDHVKELMIINLLATEEDVIPMINKILERERSMKKELLLEMNGLLSKAHVGLDEPKLNKGNFMQKEISEFYQKHKDAISHCFNKL